MAFTKKKSDGWIVLAFRVSPNESHWPNLSSTFKFSDLSLGVGMERVSYATIPTSKNFTKSFYFLLIIYSVLALDIFAVGADA